MPPSVFLLLLLFPSMLQLSAALSPQRSRFSKSRLRRSDEPPREYVEIARPLPIDSLTPSCTLSILFKTTDRAPINATYSHPRNCTWSRAVLHLSAASNGSHHDRIAAVWLSGAEILRTSTPETASNGTFWSVRKDVTRYSSLLRHTNLTLSSILDNVANNVYTGGYHLNLTFLFYNVTCNGTGAGAVNFPLSLLRPNRKSTIRKLGENPPAIASKNSLELNENPADSIIPISASGDEGFWFKIQSQYDAVCQGIKIPLNTYRAVIEVYVSFHGNDEFWYMNPPDAYIELNHLPTKRGHGAYREVLVKIDDNVVGSVIPFPVIYSGGINPLFWEPVVSIGAFNLPYYEIEITPLLGMLLDGKVHFLGLGVADALSFWLVDANLHLWLDSKVDEVQAGAIRYGNPSSYKVERESKFQLLDGKFEVEAKRKSEFSGWVNSSAGNITTYISSKLKFENEIEFKNGGMEKAVEQELKMTSKVTLLFNTGEMILNSEVKRKYPLEMKITSDPGLGKDAYLMITNLEHSMEEEKKIDGTVTSILANSQKSRGWMFVQDCDVLSGAASMHQSYEVKDDLGCYKRVVFADSGSIKNDTESFLCAVAAS